MMTMMMTTNPAASIPMLATIMADPGEWKRSTTNPTIIMIITIMIIIVIITIIMIIVIMIIIMAIMMTMAMI